MTDTTTGFEQQFAGDGSTTVFAVTAFQASDDDNIKVYILNETTKAATLKTKTTDYSVAISDSDGVTVTMVTAPTATEQLFVTLDTARTQPADFVINGKLSEQSLEEQLDEIVRQAKSLESDIKRSVKGPVGFGDGELSAYPALGLIRVNSTQDGYEAKTISELDLASFTFDWATLSDLGGSIDGANDKLLIYDASGAVNAFINPEDLTNAVTASNQGAAGVGVFKQKTGNDLEFKNINVGSAKVTITDDTGNDEIDIDVDGGLILDGEFSSNGMCARTASETYTARTITGTADAISVTDGDGVSGNPTIDLADNPVFSGTEGVQLPSGTTAQRPGTPVNGDLRYNSTSNKFEGYENSSWIDIAGSLDINGLTGESGAVTADTFAFYDATATANRKITLGELTSALDIDNVTTESTIDLSADKVLIYDDSASAVRGAVLSDVISDSELYQSQTYSNDTTVTFTGLDLDSYSYIIRGTVDQQTGSDAHYIDFDTSDSSSTDWAGTIQVFTGSVSSSQYSSSAAGIGYPTAGHGPDYGGWEVEIEVFRNANGRINAKGRVDTDGFYALFSGIRTTSSSSTNLNFVLGFQNASGSDGVNGTLRMYRRPR